MGENDTESLTKVILLAEDETMIRTLVRSLLVSEGYQVIEASDGAHALELSRAHEGRIDMLLTDIRMPRMNGTELAQHIRVERPETTVLIMSAYSSGEFERMAKSSNFIQKPFVAKVLSKKVKELLEQPPTQSEF